MFMFIDDEFMCMKLAFCLPCSSAIRTVIGWLPPSGMTLFSADIASCASSRLLNLHRGTRKRPFSKTPARLDSEETYLTNATPLGFPLILSLKMFFCTIRPYLPNITSS